MTETSPFYVACSLAMVRDHTPWTERDQKTCEKPCGAPRVPKDQACKAWRVQERHRIEALQSSA